MGTIKIDRRSVVKLNRNKRIVSNSSASSASTTSGGDSGIQYIFNNGLVINGNTVSFSGEYIGNTKIVGDLHVDGNITASKEVVSWVASAVTSNVLDALSVSEPLEKEGSNITLNYNTEQFEVNANNELQLKITTNPYNTFIYNQSIPAAVWNITHNLQRYPSVTVVDSANTTIEGNIKYIDINSILITFCAGFTGSAYLS